MKASSLPGNIIVAFAFGAIIVVAILALAILFPEPTSFQYEVFRIVLAIACGGLAAVIPGFLTVRIDALGVAIRAGGALAVFILVYFFNPAQLVISKAPLDLESRLLQEIKNYKKDRDTDKVIEKSLKLLEISPYSLESVYHAAFGYIVKNDLESFKKAKDILVLRLNILQPREMALLGLVEQGLGNDSRSYQILKNINLYDVSSSDPDDEVLPYLAVAMVRAIFSTQSYNEALNQMQEPLNFIIKKAKYYNIDPFMAGSTIKMAWHRNYWRIVSSQLLIGSIWLEHAYRNQRQTDWIKAINIASEGFGDTLHDIVTKQDILHYLSLFNGISNLLALSSSNIDEILAIITRYIRVLEGNVMPSYSQEIVKLKLLFNILSDTVKSRKDKFDIYVKDEIDFPLDIGQIQDDVAIKSVFIKKNFMLKENRNLLSSSTPVRVFPTQRTQLKIEKESTFSKDAIFIFDVVEDTSSKTSSALLIPLLFWTGFEQPS